MKTFLSLSLFQEEQQPATSKGIFNCSVSTVSTTGLTTSAPGHVLGPQHTSVPTPGIPAVPTMESSTGPAPGASSGSGLGSEKTDDFLGSDPGTNDAGTNANHVEMEADSSYV